MKYTKISDMPYVRVTKEEAIEALSAALAAAEGAKNAEELLAAREMSNAFGAKLGTMTSLASTRFNCNTRDEFYMAEMEYYVTPVITFTEGR